MGAALDLKHTTATLATKRGLTVLTRALGSAQCHNRFDTHGAPTSLHQHVPAGNPARSDRQHGVTPAGNCDVHDEREGRR